MQRRSYKIARCEPCTDVAPVDEQDTLEGHVDEHWEVDTHLPLAAQGVHVLSSQVVATFGRATSVAPQFAHPEIRNAVMSQSSPFARASHVSRVQITSLPADTGMRVHYCGCLVTEAEHWRVAWSDDGHRVRVPQNVTYATVDRYGSVLVDRDGERAPLMPGKQYQVPGAARIIAPRGVAVTFYVLDKTVPLFTLIGA